MDDAQLEPPRHGVGPLRRVAAVAVTVLVVGAVTGIIAWRTATYAGGRTRVGAPVSRLGRLTATVERALRTVPIPPGAHPVSDGGPYDLVSPPLGSTSPDFVDRSRLWIEHGTVDAALAWVAAHVPAAAVATGTASSSGPHTPSIRYVFYSLGGSWDDVNLFDDLQLLVGATLQHGIVAVRIDATAALRPARTRDQHVPTDVTGVEVTRSVRPITETSPHVTHRRLGTVAARALARDLDAAVPDMPGPRSCPNITTIETIGLRFTGGGVSPVATIDLSGCDGLVVGAGPGLSIPDGLLSDLDRYAR